MLRGLIVAIPTVWATAAAAALPAQTVAANGESPEAVSREVPILQRPAFLEVKGIPLSDALNHLSDRSGVPVAFSPSRLAAQGPVYCDCADLTVAEALDRLLISTRYRYTEVDGHIVVVARPTSTPKRLPDSFHQPRPVYAIFSGAAVSPLGREDTIVAGTVSNARTGAPVSGAVIVIEGTDQGTISDASGRFRIIGLEGQVVTLRAQMIGFRTVTQVARVGDTAVRLALVESAIELDEVVVTGTVGGAQVRAIGNAVSTIRAEGAIERRAPDRMLSLLGAEVPGIRIRSTGGEIGSGGTITIRGPGSLSVSNQPILMIDGVRVDNEPSARSAAFQERTGPSRINDIILADVDRIEVIKGPAAATLYGTEASNGVIHIITKKGRAGPPQFDIQIKQGATFLMNPERRYPSVYGRDPTTGELLSVNLVQSEKERGTPIFRTGRPQALSLSMGGATESIRYFFSGTAEREEGIVSYHNQNRFGVRTNFGYIGSENFEASVEAGFIRQSTINDGSQQPITARILWGSPLDLDTPTRGFLQRVPEDHEMLAGGEDVDRVTGSLHFKHSPRPWLTHSLRLGGDFGNVHAHSFWPRTTQQPGPFGVSNLGRKDVQHDRNTFLTVDYSLSTPFHLTSNLELEQSAGFQYYRKRFEHTLATGRIFPAPGLETISAAANRFSEQDFLENATVGLYLQERLGWQNRLFLTAAIRADDNSAFGENFTWAIYPKLSASWVVNEEPFWRVRPVNALRLRAAWGRAGQQPDVFAARRLYGPVTGPGGAPGLSPLNIGNPDLQPEIGQEIEVGFDAAMWNDRLGLEFTYFNQNRKDAILTRSAMPSLGFPGTEFINIGEVRNWGFELGARGQIIQNPTWGWELGLSYSNTDNRIEDLNGLVPPSFGSPWTGQRHVEGYPVGSLFMQKVVHAEYDTNGNLVNVLCEGGDPIAGGGPPVPCEEAGTAYFGRPIPRWDFGAYTSVRYRNATLSATADGQGGYVKCDTSIGWGHLFFRVTEEINKDRPDPILAAYDMLGANICQAGLVNGGFAKLRDVSLSYQLPEAWAQHFRASRASISLTAQNMATLWVAEDSKFGTKVVDPDIHASFSRATYANVNPATHGMEAYHQDQWPSFQRITLTLRASF